MESISTNEKPMAIKYIDPEYPQPITDSSKKRKYYVKDDIMTITFDNNFRFTQVLISSIRSYRHLNAPDCHYTSLPLLFEKILFVWLKS